MKQITFLLLAVATVTATVAFTAHASRYTDEAAPIFVTEIPRGYREWRLVSVAHEEGNLNDIRAILGNDEAIKAYREERLPFPEGTINHLSGHSGRAMASLTTRARLAGSPGGPPHNDGGLAPRRTLRPDVRRRAHVNGPSATEHAGFRQKECADIHHVGKAKAA